MNHDAGYKLLFSHSEMVAELSLGFIEARSLDEVWGH
jgi:hypothetical protein